MDIKLSYTITKKINTDCKILLLLSFVIYIIGILCFLRHITISNIFEAIAFFITYATLTFVMLFFLQDLKKDNYNKRRTRIFLAIVLFMSILVNINFYY